MEQTRRQWFALVGQAGVAALAPHIVSAEAPLALPPGLYLPSREHLGHALAHANEIPKRGSSSPGSSSPTDWVQGRTGAYRPMFFTAPEYSLVYRLANLLLALPPADVLVDEISAWIDLRCGSAAATRQAWLAMPAGYRSIAEANLGTRVRSFLDEPDRVCRAGLAWLNETSHAQHAKRFVELDEPNQLEMLASISDDSANRARGAGPRLFEVLKTEAVHAYYTSMEGLKELDFKGNGYYVRSPGCTAARS